MSIPRSAEQAAHAAFPRQRAPFPITSRAHLDKAGLALRAATHEDLPFLRSLYAQTRQHELAGMNWPESLAQQFVEQQFTLQHAHYLRHYADAAFLIVLQGNSRCGRLYVQANAPDFLVIDITLDASVRGRGMGTSLLCSVQDEARARSCGVRLHVDLRNDAAHRLYLRLGFRECGLDGPYRAMRWDPPGVS